MKLNRKIFFKTVTVLMAVHNLILVLLELTFNHLFHQIDADVHIVARLLGPDDSSLNRYRHLNLLTVLFYAQCDAHLCVRSKETIQLVQLASNRSVQPRCNLNVLSDNGVLHTQFPFRRDGS